MKTPARTAPSSGARPRRHPARVVVSGLLMLVPLSLALLGAWVGTSLAIYNDGPVWLAVVGAVVVFFLVPLGWELLIDPHDHRGRVRDAILHSSVLGSVFVVVLIATHPEDTFKALATRGDWFLGGARGGAADTVRDVVFGVADGLEWLNDAVRTKAFRERDESDAVDPGPVVVWEPRALEPPAGPVAAVVVPGVPIPGSDLLWPLPAVVEPVVARMPEAAKASIESVGRFIAAHENDPFLRVKAVHDFVATWVRYDYEELRAGSYMVSRNWEPERVFARRRAVCSGYTELMVALGEAAGVEIIRISGDVRSPSDYAGLPVNEPPASYLGHVWNAARINGRWYFIDATWDTSGPNEDGSPGVYATTYLFIPPQAMVLDHLPDAAAWQMLPAPLSRGDWLREPLVRPMAVAYGVDVREPKRPVERLAETLRFAVSNPYRVRLALALGEASASRPTTCARSAEAQVELSCPLGTGRWTAGLFGRLSDDGPGVWLAGVLIDAK